MWELAWEFVIGKEAEPRVSGSPHRAVKCVHPWEICAGDIVGWSSQE